MAGIRTDTDLRYLFMRGLISHEDNQRSRHYLKSAAECTSRAIVSLELSEDPVKSVKHARKLEGIGGETCSRLSKLESEKSFSTIKPLGGRFVSSAAGILVGLLDATEEMLHNGHKPDKDVLVSEANVRRRAERLTEEPFTDGLNEFCKAWWRLEVMIKRGYIRRRSLKKSPVLQLLPLGKTAALHLRVRVGLTSTVAPPPCNVPVPVSYTDFLPQLPDISSITGINNQLFDDTFNTNIPTTSRETINKQDSSREGTDREQQIVIDDSLYTTDTGRDGLVMLIDRREMGGEKYGLGELCRLLDSKGVCYEIKHLKVGDYSWVWRNAGREIVLPCMVERKRADDIAHTLKDGRFWSQVNNMAVWKAEFTKKGVESAIHYILERKPEEFVVKCSDGCQGIKKCGYPTLAQVKSVIEDLKHHPDLLVKETPSLEVTAVLLASFTNELKDRLEKGEFDGLLQEDLTESKKAPEGMDIRTGTDPENKSSKIVPTVNTDEYYRVEDTIEIRTSDPGNDFANLSFDEEMRIVLERSKLDLRKSGNVIDLANEDSKGIQNTVSSVIDVDNDEELALVLERSRKESHGVYSENSALNDSGISDTSDYLPMMQYHCTEGGSVYSTKFKDKNHGRDVNEYRPRITSNRKKPPGVTPTSTCSRWKDSLENIDPPNYKLETSDNVFKESDDAIVEKVSSREKVLSHEKVCRDSKINTSMFSNGRFPSNSDNSNASTACISTNIGKRKYNKNTFSFEPSPDNVRQCISSRCDKNVTSFKKGKTMLDNFVPSEECIQYNVTPAKDMTTKVARGKTRGKSKKKLGTDNSDSTFHSDENKQTCKGRKNVTQRIGKVSVSTSNNYLKEGYSSESDATENLVMHGRDDINYDSGTVEHAKEKKSEVSDSPNSEKMDEYDSEKDLFLDSENDSIKITSDNDTRHLEEESETNDGEENDDFEITSCQLEEFEVKSENLLSKHSDSGPSSRCTDSGPSSRYTDSGPVLCSAINRNRVMVDISDSSNDSLPDIGFDTYDKYENLKHDTGEVHGVGHSRDSRTDLSVFGGEHTKTRYTDASTFGLGHSSTSHADKSAFGGEHSRTSHSDTGVGSGHSAGVFCHIDSSFSADCMSDQVNLVLSVLPGTDVLKVRDVLVKRGMNVDQCVAELLDSM